MSYRRWLQSGNTGPHDGSAQANAHLHAPTHSRPPHADTTHPPIVRPFRWQRHPFSNPVQRHAISCMPVPVVLVVLLLLADAPSENHALHGHQSSTIIHIKRRGILTRQVSKPHVQPQSLIETVDLDHRVLFLSRLSLPTSFSLSPDALLARQPPPWVKFTSRSQLRSLPPSRYPSPCRGSPGAGRRRSSPSTTGCHCLRRSGSPQS